MSSAKFLPSHQKFNKRKLFRVFEFFANVVVKKKSIQKPIQIVKNLFKSTTLAIAANQFKQCLIILYYHVLNQS